MDTIFAPLTIKGNCSIYTIRISGNLVLDCFSGSGTTAVACHDLKRRFICIEKDKEYYEKSIERLKQAQIKQRLF